MGAVDIAVVRFCVKVFTLCVHVCMCTVFPFPPSAPSSFLFFVLKVGFVAFNPDLLLLDQSTSPSLDKSFFIFLSSSSSSPSSSSPLLLFF